MPGLFYVISMKSCNIQSRCSASVSPDAQVTRINVPSAISCIFLLYGQAPVPRLSNTTDVLQPQHITGIQSQADRVTSTPWQMAPSSAPPDRRRGGCHIDATSAQWQISRRHEPWCRPPESRNTIHFVRGLFVKIFYEKG